MLYSSMIKNYELKIIRLQLPADGHTTYLFNELQRPQFYSSQKYSKNVLVLKYLTNDFSAKNVNQFFK